MPDPAHIYKEEDDHNERPLDQTQTQSVHLTQQINIRLSNKDIERIDKEIERMEQETPGLEVTRSEMGRILLLRGLNK